jgi:tRNA (cmo5U34)-methyltransferase
MKKDILFTGGENEIGQFKFSQEVAEVFENMLSRSIPGYNLILQHIPAIIAPHISKNSIVYDLGCSVGGASIVMANEIKKLSQGNKTTIGKVVAVDNSQPMLEELATKIKNLDLPIEVCHADIAELKFIEKPDVVCLNFTLMFIKESLRIDVLKNIYGSLNKNGIIILSEKTTTENEKLNNKIEKMYFSYKESVGYSKSQIKNKKKSLESVLIPNTTKSNIAKLESAGFKEIVVWFQCLQFVSIIAIK